MKTDNLFEATCAKIRAMLKLLIVVSLINIVAVCLPNIANTKAAVNAEDEKRNANMNPQYGENFKLKMNEKVQFSDGLSITLHSFSHKRPYTGGSTKATAFLEVSKNNETGQVMLSVRGIDGKSENEDGISNSNRYINNDWNVYKFQLKAFSYNQEIELIVN